jgi:hypothetical protein
MRKFRAGIFVAVAVLGACCCLAAQEVQTVDVTGKLSRVMAIGGESTGWALQLDSPLNIDGKQVASIEVDYKDAKKLEKLEDKHVRATGTITHRHGTETAERTILEATSVKPAK